jgi:hypothetical protein
MQITGVVTFLVGNIQHSSVLPSFHILWMFNEFALPWLNAPLDHPVEIEAGNVIVGRQRWPIMTMPGR